MMRQATRCVGICDGSPGKRVQKPQQGCSPGSEWRAVFQGAKKRSTERNVTGDLQGRTRKESRGSNQRDGGQRVQIDWCRTTGRHGETCSAGQLRRIWWQSWNRGEAATSRKQEPTVTSMLYFTEPGTQPTKGHLRFSFLKSC